MGKYFFTGSEKDYISSFHNTLLGKYNEIMKSDMEFDTYINPYINSNAGKYLPSSVLQIIKVLKTFMHGINNKRKIHNNNQ